MMPDSALPVHIAGDIERDGYAVLPDWLEATAVAALAAECRDLHARSLMRPAAVGHAGARHVDAAIRGDRTFWFDAAQASAAQQRYWQPMQALRIDLNRELLLGLDDLEAHYAMYAPGARYARHRDRFRDDDARVLSSVLYLNADWNAADGGALRLYLPDAAPGRFVDIVPRGGTLVLFLSAEFEHEVLAATRERLSIAGWFRRSHAQRL